MLPLDLLLFTGKRASEFCLYEILENIWYVEYCSLTLSFAICASSSESSEDISITSTGGAGRLLDVEATGCWRGKGGGRGAMPFAWSTSTLA